MSICDSSKITCINLMQFLIDVKSIDFNNRK